MLDNTVHSRRTGQNNKTAFQQASPTPLTHTPPGAPAPPLPPPHTQKQPNYGPHLYQELVSPRVKVFKRLS